MASRDGHDALIFRILRGDRERDERAVATLAGDEADGGRRWQIATDRRWSTRSSPRRSRRRRSTSRSTTPSGGHSARPRTATSPRALVVARLPVRRLRRLGRRARPVPARPVARARLRRPRPDAHAATGRPRARCASSAPRSRSPPTSTCRRGRRPDPRRAGRRCSAVGPTALAELWNDWGTVRPLLLEERLAVTRLSRRDPCVRSAARSRPRVRLVLVVVDDDQPQRFGGGDPDRLALLGGPGADPLGQLAGLAGSGWRGRRAPRSCARASP